MVAPAVATSVRLDMTFRRLGTADDERTDAYEDGFDVVLCALAKDGWDDALSPGESGKNGHYTFVYYGDGYTEYLDVLKSYES